MIESKRTIVLFGDSLLGRFGKSLIDSLEAKTGHTIVLNCAAGGWTSEDGQKKATIVSKLEPDYIILSFGANDAAPWKKQVTLDDFKRNIDSILNTFSQSKIIVFLCPPAGMDDKTPNTEFNILLQKFNLVFKQEALHTRAQIVELNTIEGKLLRNGNDYHLGDGIHLNEEGYEIFIEEVSKLIK